MDKFYSFLCNTFISLTSRFLFIKKGKRPVGWLIIFFVSFIFFRQTFDTINVWVFNNSHLEPEYYFPIEILIIGYILFLLDKEENQKSLINFFSSYFILLVSALIVVLLQKILTLNSLVTA